MKRRDAGTGQYISEEEAKSKPRNTWVSESDNQIFLRRLYEDLLSQAGHAECEDFESIKVSNVTKIFKKFGLKL